MSDIERYRHGHRSFKSFLLVLLLHHGFQLVLALRTVQSIRTIPMIGRPLGEILWFFVRLVYKCDISLEAKIGKGFYVPHAIGICIGPSVRIGERATVLQNVTIGRRSQSDIRDPEIGNDVVIGCNAVILGNVKIGDECMIGATCIVVDDVPSGYRVVGSPSKPIPRKEHIIK